MFKGKRRNMYTRHTVNLSVLFLYKWVNIFRVESCSSVLNWGYRDRVSGNQILH